MLHAIFSESFWMILNVNFSQSEFGKNVILQPNKMLIHFYNNFNCNFPTHSNEIEIFWWFFFHFIAMSEMVKVDTRTKERKIQWLKFSALSFIVLVENDFLQIHFVYVRKGEGNTFYFAKYIHCSNLKISSSLNLNKQSIL